MSETTWPEEILLSLIVPVYDLETYLPETLDSLLRIELDKPYEIVAVDDGSRDGSLKILREYERKDGRIRVISAENGGVSRARNLGIDAARGSWLAFVDGDDTVEPGFFRTAVDEAEKGGYGIVQGIIRFLEDGKILKEMPGREFIPDGRLESGDPEELAELFFGRSETLTFSACAKIFRRELVGKTRFPEGIRIAEDQKFVFELLRKNPKVLILNQDAYIYSMRDSSVMHSGYAEKGWDAIGVLEDCETAALSPRIRRHIRKRKTDVWVRIYNTATLTGKDPERALQAIRGTNVREIREDLTEKERVKLVLLQRCRPAYNLLLKVSKA